MTTGGGATGRVIVPISLKHYPNAVPSEKENDTVAGVICVNSVTTYVGHDFELGIPTVMSNAKGNVTILKSREDP